MHTLANYTVWLEKFADDSFVIVTGSDSALATRDQIFYSEALGHFFSPNQPTNSFTRQLVLFENKYLFWKWFAEGVELNIYG